MGGTLYRRRLGGDFVGTWGCSDDDPSGTLKRRNVEY